MNRVVQILMKRDGMTASEATLAVEDCRDAILEDAEYADDVLMDMLGLEPDYLEDILWS
jgi:hypothetical protein